MTIQELIEELQEDYDPEMLITFVNLQTKDGIIYWYAVDEPSPK